MILAVRRPEHLPWHRQLVSKKRAKSEQSDSGSDIVSVLYDDDKDVTTRRPLSDDADASRLYMNNINHPNIVHQQIAIKAKQPASSQSMNSKPTISQPPNNAVLLQREVAAQVIPGPV